eukprot:3612325-Pleurochrysis_carterae.AAC.1
MPTRPRRYATAITHRGRKRINIISRMPVRAHLPDNVAKNVDIPIPEGPNRRTRAGVERACESSRARAPAWSRQNQEDAHGGVKIACGNGQDGWEHNGKRAALEGQGGLGNRTALEGGGAWTKAL